MNIKYIFNIGIFFFLLSFGLVSSATFGYNSAEIIVQTTGGAVTGDCPSGQFVQNITSSELECSATAGSGDITSVTAGTGLTGGGESGDVTLNVFADTCGGGEVSKYNGSGFSCETDQTGGAGGQNTSGIYLYNDSDTHFFNTTFAGTNLAVNSSDYWDGFNTFNTTQFENQGGLLHLIDSWITSLINIILGNYFDQDLNTTDDVTFKNITANNITADFYFGNGSQLQGLTLTESDPYWTGNQSSYYLTTNPFTFWNDTYATFNKTYADTLYVGNNSAGWTLNITHLWVNMFYTPTSSFEYTFDDDGSDIIMDFSSIGGTNSLFLETAGTFLEMIANPGPSNDYEMFAFEETQGDDTAINFYEGGVGHNRIWNSGSMRIGGDKSSLCSNLTTDVDCDTSGTGADLVVQDDGWFGGKLFSSDWTNVSITETQISDLQVYLLQSNTTLAGNYSATTDFCIDGGACLSAISGGSGITWATATNGTLYLSSNPFSFYNSTIFDYNDYYLESNPFSFYNITDFDFLDYRLLTNISFIGNLSTTVDYCIDGGACLSAISGGSGITWAMATNGTLFTQALWNTNYTANNLAWLNTTNLTYHAYNNSGLIKDWTIDITSANTTMKDYVDALDTATNTTAINWVDALFPRISELVGLLGNWSADTLNYYTKAEVTTNITSANTTMKNYCDATFVDVAGDTMTGNLTMGNNYIVNGTGGAYIYHNGTGWVIQG